MPPSELKREWRDVPGETNRICFRPLSILELHEAKRKRDAENQDAAFKIMDRIGKSEITETLQSPEAQAIREAQRAERAETADTDPANFDTEIVLRCGIVDWNYTYEDGSPYPCGDAAKISLDPASGEWAVSVILALSSRTPGNANGSEESSKLTRSRRS